MKRNLWSFLAVSGLMGGLVAGTVAGAAAFSGCSGAEDDDDATSEETPSEEGIAGTVAGTYLGSGVLGGTASTSYVVTVTRVNDTRIEISGDVPDYEADIMESNGKITSLAGASVQLEFETSASPITFQMVNGNDNFQGSKQ